MLIKKNKLDCPFFIDNLIAAVGRFKYTSYLQIKTIKIFMVILHNPIW